MKLGKCWETARWHLSSHIHTELRTIEEVKGMAMSVRGRGSNSTTRCPRVASLLCAGLASVAGLFFAPTAALAGGGLASVVLTNTLPGLVASAPGTTNGPISGAALKYLPSDENSGQKLLLYLSNNEVNAGYIRAWTRQPPNGDVVFIFAFTFKSTAAQTSWLTGLNAGFQGQPGGTTFAVPDVPGAEGYTAHVADSAGTPATEYVVTFDKGPTTFMVIVGSSTGDLTSADAASLAATQSANAPGAFPPSSKAKDYEIGGAIGAALLVVLIVISVRHRRNRPLTNTTPTNGFQPSTYQPNAAQPSTVRAPSSSSYPPPPTEPQEPGWTAIGDFEWYWDGRAWTNRRELTHAEPKR